MKIQKLAFVLLGSALLSASAFAEEAVSASPFVNIKINSGDPAYPFPQFQEYKGGGKSLAKYNAEGVTHADMEKTMREAYEIMSHRCRYEKTEQSGVKYITFNNVNDYEELESVPVFCTEGDGYMLLASAIFADQPTFNGLWMWIHDNRMSDVKRYSDGEWLRKGKNRGNLAGWSALPDSDEEIVSSATDGDNDIAMALLIAYKQWGEFMRQDGEIVKDFEGNPISYKQIAEDYVKALVDTVKIDIPNPDGSIYHAGYLSGDIGVDGYPKYGNQGGELTKWRETQILNDQLRVCVYVGTGSDVHTCADYNAPSYYTEFADWLENGDGNGTEWEISQFKRGAASSNWLNKQAYDQGLIPSIGRVSMKNDTMVTFEAFGDGEDFRYPWRHMLDYLWHGDASDGWDPIAHAVIKGEKNTSEYDMAIRYAELLKNPSEGGTLICKQMGAAPEPDGINLSGICQIPHSWDLRGEVQAPYRTVLSLGAGSPAAVISGDVDLVADLYRQCETTWDDQDYYEGDDAYLRYLGSTPKYFHGWFRTLGMLVASGNMMAPSEMESRANVKVYMSVDKTYAYEGDKVTYGVQCRNYGSKAAENLVVTTPLDPDYKFVSATKGGSYDAASHAVTWKIASLPGFKTGALDATIDSLSFTVKVSDTQNKLVGLTTTVKGSNFETWESNEYPNNATYTMERNLVDILKSTNRLEKLTDVESASEGDTIAVTLRFTNDTSTCLTGGRDHVNVSFGYQSLDDYAADLEFRFWNDAYEAYIDLSNYRISYFLYDTMPQFDESNYTPYLGKCGTYFGGGRNERGDLSVDSIVMIGESLSEGSSEAGKWNQRIMLRYRNLMAPTSKMGLYCHKGVKSEFYMAFRKSNIGYDVPIEDWSLDPQVKVSTVPNKFTLVSPSWAANDGEGYSVDRYLRNQCSDYPETTTSRILVEEWDGFTWRKILGSSPVTGMNYTDVTITDTLSKYLEFCGVADSANCQVKMTDGVLNVTAPSLKVGETISVKYLCRIKKGAPAGEFAMGSATLVAGDNKVSASADPTVTIGECVGMEELTTFDENERVDVYNALGALLRKHVLWKDALNGLPTGVYMVNNKKVVYKE